VVAEPLHDVVETDVVVEMVGSDVVVEMVGSDDVVEMVGTGYVELRLVAVLALLNMHIHHLEV
jgi:hypothetical protein